MGRAGASIARGQRRQGAGTTRRPLSDPLGLTRVLLAAADAGPVRFADLAAATCYPAIARAFAIRLIWRRALAIDLAEPFGDASVVWPGAVRSGR